MATVGTTNVTASAVQTVLENAGGSVTDNLTSFFTTNAKINMWSKYKPVVSTTLFHTLSTWQSSGFRGDDGKCGIKITTYSPSSFKTAAKNGTTGWSYTPPTGGTTQPRRLGDFRGYCSDAYNPMGDFVTNGLITSGKVSFQMDMALSGTSSTNLTLDDIKIGGSSGTSLSQYYPGVFVWNSSTSYFYTSSSKLGSNSSFNVSVPITTAGKYNYIPFLSSAAQTTGSDVSATVISCGKSAKEVNIVSSNTLRKVEAFGSWNPAGTAVVEITAYISNTTSSSVTFSGITVQLRRSTGTSAAASSLVSTVTYSGSVTVPAQSTKSVTISDISHSRSSSYNYWLAAYATQTTETTYNEIDEQSPEG